MIGRFLLNDPTEKSQHDTVTKQNVENHQKNKQTINATYNFMSLHHVVKLLINLLVFFFSIRSENIGCLSIRAVAASVFLLVKGL